MALKFFNFRFIQESLSFLVLFYLLLSYTGQKIFRTELILLGLFFYISISIFIYIKTKIVNLNLSYLFCILISVLSFLRWAEYDPIQVFPQKVALKVIGLFWFGYISYLFLKLKREDFKRIGILVAILPIVSLTFYHPYPLLILSLAFFYIFSFDDLKSIFASKVSILVFLSLLVLIFRDWTDDSALRRCIILMDAFILYHLLHRSQSNIKKIFLDSFSFVYFLTVCIIFIEAGNQSEFVFLQMHETLFHLPVSMVGSHSFLFFIIGFVFVINAKNKAERTYYFLIVLFSTILILLSGSRASMISLILSFVLISFFVLKYKRKNVLFGFSASVAILFIILFAKIGKSFSNIDSTVVRLNIWDFHFSATSGNALFFGFGLFPEENVLFANLSNLSPRTYDTILSYLDHFHSYPLAHNLYFQVFSSIGGIGFFIVLFLLIRFAFLNIKSFPKYEFVQKSFFILILVWFFHELLDFNSLELPNTLLLSTIFSFVIPSSKNQNEKFYRVAYFSIGLFLILIFGLLTIRWTKIEERSQKYKKDIVETNFYHFKHLGKSKIPYEFTDSPISYFLFGDKFYFQELALSEGNSEEGEILSHCFKFKSKSAFCNFKTIEYIDKKNLQPNLRPLFLYLLKKEDSFDIYGKILDEKTKN